MDFNALIAELRASSENLPKDSADRSLLSSVYCNKACKVLDQVADTTDYDSTITGLWLVAAHFAEQLVYLKPVPALSELCFKLFRQCAKAVLNIQWQNLEEDSSLKQNFLASLANLHARLVPLDFPRFRLLEALTENPWTNPTLAKVMGGEVDDSDKEEVRQYIEQEDPIILQLRVDMMLKENCEEYALNLCNSCLSHPELQSDLGVRKTQLSLLYKLGQEDKLQEECQKLSIQDAVRIIKQLQTYETHRQICTVLAQTFMVQNWIRPSDMEANKELLRLWIRHQLLVDREQDQFKESVWAMAKLSQSTEQIIIFIDVLREECGESFLQLYVDMCIFAINVDKGQMETNKKEGNMEAAAARRSDMASICAKLSCLCHHASVKVARICALTSFALRPTEQSFAKIGTFYGQGTDCCNKCGRDKNREPGTVNPATLYEVERLLNMLRPDYLNPDQSYANIQILCRRFLQESLKSAQLFQRKQFASQNSSSLPVVTATLGDGQVKKPSTSCRPTNVFEALSPQDYQNTQMLLNRMRLQNIPEVKIPISTSTARHIYSSGTTRPNIIQQGQQSSSSLAGQTVKAQYVFDVDNIKSKQPYGVPVEQQHQYYLMKHQKELEQRRKNAQKKREEKTQQIVNLNSQLQQQNPQLLQQQRQQQLQKQHSDQVTQMIQTAIQQDSSALQKLTHGAGPGVVQAVLSIMKGAVLKQSNQSAPIQQPAQVSQQVKHIVSSTQHSTQPQVTQQVKHMVSATQQKTQPQVTQQVKHMVSATQQGTQPLPTVSTLLKPSVQMQPQLPKQQQVREQSPPRRHPRPQLYAQPIIISTTGNMPQKVTPPAVTILSNRSQVTPSSNNTSVSSSGEKQKAESFMLAKSHVEDIRRFMQLQMSNLQQKQIAQPHQMSGSTVTLTNVPIATTSSAHIPFSVASKPKTTVELAQQAAVAKLQKQESSKQGIFPQSQQVKINLGQTFATQPERILQKSVQPQYVTSISLTHGIVQPQQQKLSHAQQPQQQKLSHAQQPQQQKLSHAQQQKLSHAQQPQQQNNAFNFQNIQTSAVSSNPVLPSSDELSGSIMGIDDTIIKELLQDSGILANTFPDIEVDTVSEDKSRKIPEISSLPQTVIPPVSNQMPKSAKSSLYTYPSAPTQQTTYTCQRVPKTLSVHGSTVSKMSDPQNVASATNLSGSYVQSPGSGINKYSTLPTSCPMDALPNRTLAPSVSQTFAGVSNQTPSGLQARANTKSATFIEPPENMSAVTKKEVKEESWLTVDQLREMMKKEDIQGEVCMDAANNATYRCIICSLAFETLDHLREHVRNVCKPGLQSSSVYNTKIKQDRANSAKAGVETTTVFQCLRCFELCVSDSGIKQHRLTCKRVPTVPSDLKKENTAIKQKPVPKATVPKQLMKKEPQDNSHKVPEMPLPFPYPSLNAEAVLKSMAASGSLFPTSNLNVGSKPQVPARTGDLITKPNVTVPTPNITLKTAPVPDFKASPSSSNLGHTNMAETPFPSVNITVSQHVSSCNPVVNTGSFSTKMGVLLPHRTHSTETVITDTHVIEQGHHSKEVEKPHPKEVPERVTEPRFTEITGSGGSKFYKCKICSQTLCSLESFLVHWKECATKNRSVLKKIEFQEKLANAEPVTGDVLENLLGVVAAVAEGGGTIPEDMGLDPEWSDIEDIMCELKDPCKAGSHERAVSSEDSDLEMWDEGEHCETSQEIISELDSIMDGKKDGSDDVITPKERDDEYEKDGEEEENGKVYKKSKTKLREDDDDEEEEEEESSEGEQTYLLSSTREVPPQLRDRKTLKPIQSFINETFNAPFNKATLKPANTKSDKFKASGDEGEEKVGSENEVESDGDGLYCKVCQTSFQTKRILLQHFAGKHLQPYTVKTVADSSSYFCHLCQKTFSTFMHYMQHVPNHSVTIYEKMKAFTASNLSSQRSERIASQRGLPAKDSLSTKIVKPVKNKKSVDQLNQQLLAGKTQSVRERLKISKRKRSLPSAFTSSDDEYSSDASSNVVFKSRKSTERENWSDCQRPVTRSRIARPGKMESRLCDEDGENSNLSSLDLSDDESDRGPRLSRVRDEDYVLSEDIDSDGMDEKAPPTTRSRKRLAHNLQLSDLKRRKISGGCEINQGNLHDTESDQNKDRMKCLQDTNLSDSDTDSRSSVLVLSQSQSGKYVPFDSIPETESVAAADVKETTELLEGSKESVSSQCLIVRSLSKRQKERLKSCDLHPTVVLEIMNREDFDSLLDIHLARTASDPQNQDLSNKICVNGQEAHGNSPMDDASTSAPIKNKSSSFLDSFLSYLTQYSTSDVGQSKRKRNKSGPPGVLRHRRRRNSFDSGHISDPSQSPAILSRSSSSTTEVEGQGSVEGTETNTSDSSIPLSDNNHLSCSNQNLVQGILSKFPTRKCSVNLGEKLSLEDLKANVDSLSHSRITAQNKIMSSLTMATGHKKKTESSTNSSTSSSSLPVAEKKPVPVVCLERNEVIDMYATKSASLSEKISSSKSSLLAEPKKQKTRSSSHDTDSTSEQLVCAGGEADHANKESQSEPLTDKDKTNCQTFTSQQSQLHAEVDYQLSECVSVEESTRNIISNLDTKIDHIPQTCISDSCPPTQEGSASTNVVDSEMVVKSQADSVSLSAVSDSMIVDMPQVLQQEDSEGYVVTVDERCEQRNQNSAFSVQNSGVYNVEVNAHEAAVPAREDALEKYLESGREKHLESGTLNNEESILIGSLPQITDGTSCPIISSIVDKHQVISEEKSERHVINPKMVSQSRNTEALGSEGAACKSSVTCSDVTVHTESHISQCATLTLIRTGTDESYGTHQDRNKKHCMSHDTTKSRSENSAFQDSHSCYPELAADTQKTVEQMSEKTVQKPETVEVTSRTLETASRAEVASVSGRMHCINKEDMPQCVQLSPGCKSTSGVSTQANFFEDNRGDQEKTSGAHEMPVVTNNDDRNSPTTEDKMLPKSRIFSESQKDTEKSTVNFDENDQVREMSQNTCVSEDKDHPKAVIDGTGIEKIAGSSAAGAVNDESEQILPERQSDTEVDIRQPSYPEDTGIDISQLDHPADAKNDIRQPSGADGTGIDIHQCDHPNDTKIDIQRPSGSDDTGIDIHQPGTSRDEFDMKKNVTGTKIVTPVKCVENFKNKNTASEFDASKQNSTLIPNKEKTCEKPDVGACKPKSCRKQNSQGRVALNPSNSLAAFIAERLTKEDLQAESVSRANQVRTFRQIGQDSPLDIGNKQPEQFGSARHTRAEPAVSTDYQFSEAIKPDYVREADSNLPLEVDSHAEEMKSLHTAQSLGLVDYSSSESEEENLQCGGQAVVNRGHVKGGRLCVDEQIINVNGQRRQVSNSLDIVEVDRTHCVWQELIPLAGSGVQQELKEGTEVRICCVQDKDSNVLQYNECQKTPMRDKCCKSSEGCMMVGSSPANGQDQPEERITREVLIGNESNTQCHVSVTSLEQVHNIEQSVGHQDILWEIDKNTIVNGNQDMDCLRGVGYQETLQTVNTENTEGKEQYNLNKIDSDNSALVRISSDKRKSHAEEICQGTVAGTSLSSCKSEDQYEFSVCSRTDIKQVQSFEAKLRVEKSKKHEVRNNVLNQAPLHDLSVVAQAACCDTAERELRGVGSSDNGLPEIYNMGSSGIIQSHSLSGEHVEPQAEPRKLAEVIVEEEIFDIRSDAAHDTEGYSTETTDKQDLSASSQICMEGNEDRSIESSSQNDISVDEVQLLSLVLGTHRQHGVEKDQSLCEVNAEPISASHTDSCDYSAGEGSESSNRENLVPDVNKPDGEKSHNSYPDCFLLKHNSHQKSSEDVQVTQYSDSLTKEHHSSIDQQMVLIEHWCTDTIETDSSSRVLGDSLALGTEHVQGCEPGQELSASSKNTSIPQQYHGNMSQVCSADVKMHSPHRRALYTSAESNEKERNTKSGDVLVNEFFVSSSRLDTNQRGLANTLAYRQTGVGDTSTYKQTGVGDTSTYKQTEVGDTSTYKQTEVGDTSAYKQTGVGNTSSYEQTEVGDASTYEQTGVDDTSTYDQTGVGNTSTYEQTGVGDTSTYDQTGVGNTSTYDQTGVGNTSTYDQTGVGNTSTYEQTGVGDTSTYRKTDAGACLTVDAPITHPSSTKQADKHSLCDSENHAGHEKITCASQCVDGDKQPRETVLRTQSVEAEEDASQEQASGADTVDENSEKKQTSSETDDGDDLSDFDLVIEKDTSYRSLMPFSFNLEKKGYSPFSQHSSSSYLTQGKAASISGITGPSGLKIGVGYNKSYSRQDQESVVGQHPCSSLKKVLAGSRNIRKGSQEQFVWDVDDDNDSSSSLVSFSVPLAAALTTKNSAEVISNPALEALKRKQRALREKSETTPFTWDEEDFVETPVDRSRTFISVQGLSNAGHEFLSSDKTVRGRIQNLTVKKVRKEVVQRRRPLTPDVAHGIVPVKFRRTSSTDRGAKISNSSVNRKLKRENGGCVKPDEGTAVSNVTVDSSFEGIGKAPPADSQSVKQGSLPYSAGHETKVRRERVQKQPPVTSQSTVVHQDEKPDSSGQAEEEDPPKSQPGLRSRHSSMESNKSDKSLTTKRSSAADTASQAAYKRSRKTEDPLTPKLKKIGLIKIAKDSRSPPLSSGPDSTAPLTRSSEAAIKAFNQKSLRNRGVNPVQSSPPPSSSSSTIKTASPNLHIKNSPEASPKLKGSLLVPKVTSSLSSTNRNSNAEIKSESSPKSSVKKSQDGNNAMAAVVKRRSPSLPVSSSRSGHSKSPVALRSRKGAVGLGKNQPTSASMTVFRVDPLPSTAIMKGTFKSQSVPSTKGTRTLHTPITPGTPALRLKRDASKQPKWKISKETKQARGKKQQRGPLSFKRT